MVNPTIGIEGDSWVIPGSIGSIESHSSSVPRKKDEIAMVRGGIQTLCSRGWDPGEAVFQVFQGG